MINTLFEFRSLHSGGLYGIILVDVDFPLRWVHVAGEDTVAATFVVASLINQIEEMSGILLKELTVSHSIND